MDEFLKEYYTLITFSLEFIAFFTGVVLYRKYKATPAKFIVYFLGYALVVDFIGNYPSFLWKHELFYLIKGTLIEKNYWWYTIFWWCGLSFFVYFVNHKVIQSLKFKTVMRYAYYLYLLQVVLALIFRFKYLFTPNESIIRIASFWIILLSIVIYFFEVLTSNRVVYFYKSINFYFNATIFVWILIMIPMDFFEAYFNTEDWGYVLFKWKIYLGLNIFLYLTMTIALVYCRPERKELTGNERV